MPPSYACTPGAVICRFNWRAKYVYSTCPWDLQHWFGGRHSIEITEEIVGPGNYGKTLTILTAENLPDPEELEEDDDLVDSWTPRFKR